jgi:hypothetical protein
MDKLLNREKSAEYLNEKGVRSSRVTLARLAMSGEGPKYALIGRTAYCKPEWLDEWLESQMTPRSHSLAHMHAKNGGSNG